MSAPGTAALAWLFGLLALPSCNPPDRPGLGGAGGGCARDGGPQCADDPWACPPGTTCWVTDKTDNAFACLRSVSGAREGAPCDAVIGEARCDEGYLCFTRNASTPGVCLRYCSTCGADHGCDAGQSCQSVDLGGMTTVHACVGAADGG